MNEWALKLNSKQADQLRQEYKDEGLSMTQLAEKWGIGVATVHSYVHAKQKAIRDVSLEDKILQSDKYLSGDSFTASGISGVISGRHTVKEISAALGKLYRIGKLNRERGNSNRDSMKYCKPLAPQRLRAIVMGPWRKHTNEELGILTGWRAYK